MTDRDRFASLTEAERRILALLAKGHTAKTIAAALGLSVHAVNERLREARRKTGAASSRELARALAAQDNRDDKIGVAMVPSVEDAGPPPPHGAVDGLRKVLVPMTLFIGLGLAGALVAGGITQGSSAVPRVVATIPVADSTIAPGPFVLSVTFDRPMAQGSYSFVTMADGRFPTCTGTPRQSDDGRTFTWTCTAVGSERYAVGLNWGRFTNFRAAATGVPAAPARLLFRAAR